jgi:hypothetical protein
MPEVELWVGSSRDAVGFAKIRKLEELLPVTSPLFERDPVHFSSAQWELFLMSASRLSSDFPVLSLLDTLPAVFINDEFVESATAWLTKYPDVKVVVGSAEELSRASTALVEANAREGISSEPVIRSIMFATAPVGIGKQVSIWCDVAPS